MKSDASLVLGDVVSLQRGTTYKSLLLGEPGPVLLGLASIKRNGGFRDDSLRTYGGESPEKLVLRPGDIYVSLKDVTQSADLLGAVARVPPHVVAGRLTQDTVKLTFLRKDVPPSYVYWLLWTPFYREYCRAHAIGTTNLSISRDDFLAFPVPRPNKNELALVEALEVLDGKIELNRRMNATLEAMARALFQSWFADFELDRGDDLGFVDSALGSIPNGWSVETIGDVSEVVDCLHAKKPERCKFGRLFLQLNNIRDDGLLDVGEAFLISEEDYEKWTSRMEATQGDCVITNVGRVGAVAQIPAGVTAALGRNMTGLRCKAGFPYPTFLIESLLSDPMREEIRRKTDTGTILDALNVKSIPKLRIVRPPNEILAHFEALVRPMRERMERNLSESRTLVSIRDTLLPKLLSGEMRIPDAKTIEKVA